MSEWTNGVSAVDAPKELTLKILESLLEEVELEGVHFRLWDSSYWPDPIPTSATIVLNRPSALREMLQAGTEAAIGEAYVQGAFDIEGEFEAAFGFGDFLMNRSTDWSTMAKMGYLLHRLPAPPKRHAHSLDHSARLDGRQHSLERDRRAVQFHYDVSNHFYQLWLDPWMAYSCAYFSHPDQDLAAAQVNKFDYICRKLGLKPGHRLLDIGCGWGGLLIHAATHYGIMGAGITLSMNQAELAQKKIKDAGLADRIHIHLHDYRELDSSDAYDAIVSVGMVEHVGVEKLSDYFRQTMKLLKPGGLFMNHGIGLGPAPLPEGSGSFIDQHVFPDTSLISIGQMLEHAERARFEVRDVESLREHYALTLHHWCHRLEKRHDDALEYVSEAIYRTWRLYMAGCAYRFKKGQLSIYQTLLAKLDPQGSSAAPLTRASWYPSQAEHKLA